MFPDAINRLPSSFMIKFSVLLKNSIDSNSFGLLNSILEIELRQLFSFVIVYAVINNSKICSKISVQQFSVLTLPAKHFAKFDILNTRHFEEISDFVKEIFEYKTIFIISLLKTSISF